jgi:hypothetical protein
MFCAILIFWTVRMAGKGVLGAISTVETKSQVITKIPDGATPGETGLITSEVDGIGASLLTHLYIFKETVRPDEYGTLRCCSEWLTVLA